MSYHEVCLSKFDGMTWYQRIPLKKSGSDWKCCWLTQKQINKTYCPNFIRHPGPNDNAGIAYLKFALDFHLVKFGLGGLSDNRHLQPIKVGYSANEGWESSRTSLLKEVLVPKHPLRHGRDLNNLDEELRVFVCTPYVELFEDLLKHELLKIFDQAHIPGSCQREICTFSWKGKRIRVNDAIMKAIKCMYKVAKYVNSCDSGIYDSDEDNKQRLDYLEGQKIVCSEALEIPYGRKIPLDHGAVASRKEFLARQWKAGVIPEGMGAYIRDLGYEYKCLKDFES